jgi:hypothetical protein
MVDTRPLIVKSIGSVRFSDETRSFTEDPLRSQHDLVSFGAILRLELASYRLPHGVWIGANGYHLKQLTDPKD